MLYGVTVYDVVIRSIRPSFVHHLRIDDIFCRLKFGCPEGCLSQIDFICKAPHRNRLLYCSSSFKRKAAKPVISGAERPHFCQQHDVILKSIEILGNCSGSAEKVCDSKTVLLSWIMHQSVHS